MEELFNFWTGRDPCWRLLDCSRYVCSECSAYLHPEIPCWNHVSTQLEKLLGIKRECNSCKVFKIYNDHALLKAKEL